MPAVLLLATLDTKGHEIAFVRDRIVRAGLKTLLVDAGALGEPLVEADFTRSDVFKLAGSSLEEVRAANDRGRAVALAAHGVAELAKALYEQGKIAGALAIGGSAGTTIGTSAMRALPFGLPRVMVSTLASGQTRPYLQGSDIALFPSVADIAGLNRITRRVLANAAAALVGMIRGIDEAGDLGSANQPTVAATMFGVTTPCVDRARAGLDARGYEVLVFHATGVGGQAMEGLIRDGQIDGVLDLTTTELADEIVGGILSAGPDRLKAAGRRGVPQVVSVGAVDMVNFGPPETVPERFRSRLFHIHNPTVTLMRTTPAENTLIGRRIGETLRETTGPVVVLLPEGGVSTLDAPGRPFYDPEADSALFGAIESALADRPEIRVVRRPEHINDPAFADAAAGALAGLMSFTR